MNYGLFRALCGYLGCALLLSGSASAALVTPTFGGSGHPADAIDAYAVRHGVVTADCLGTAPCSVIASMPFQEGDLIEWFYSGEMSAHVDAAIAPGTLTVYMELYGAGSAACNSMQCGPMQSVGALASARFGNDLFVDVPAAGTLYFDLALDGGPPTRYVFAVQPGFQAIMPLVLYDELQFTITSEQRTEVTQQRSLVVSNIQLVPEPSFGIPIGLALLGLRWCRRRS